MDYKEKYEQAINFIKDLYPHTSDYVKEKLDDFFPELKDSKDERIRKTLIRFHKSTIDIDGIKGDDIVAWLEKQGEQNPTQETESFEAEHGKYYYCIKDYFCGGRKQASKGDVVQALRGLPIMGLKDVSEYFLPVNSVNCSSAWSEKDEKMLNSIIEDFGDGKTSNMLQEYWLKSLKDRVQPQNCIYYNPYKEVVESIAEMCKHYDKASHSGLRDFYDNVNVKCKDAKEYDSLFPQNTWKPSDEQMEALAKALSLAKSCGEEWAFDIRTLYEQFKAQKGE